ncbi:hypothetical protein NADE_004160 [Nannochloris sp. 'desiccata']|nr:hypothetical protein NADE_004160 [Chlorella desiccata (nom. nud.)]
MHSLIRHRFSVRDPDQYFQQVLGINSLYAFTVPTRTHVHTLETEEHQKSNHHEGHRPIEVQPGGHRDAFSKRALAVHPTLHRSRCSNARRVGLFGLQAGPKRYQAVRIQSTIGKLKDSTLGTYIKCLLAGWVACIDERNRQQEHKDDPWDYVAYPMIKASTIIYNRIVPKFKCNGVSQELVRRFETNLSAIDVLRKAQLGVPNTRLEVKNDLVVELARESLKGGKRKRCDDPNIDLAKNAQAKYFTDEERALVP